MVSVAVRGNHADRGEEDAGGRLSPRARHDRQGHRLDRPAEGAHARQAVLRLLRAGCDARAAPRAQGVGRQVQGPIRHRMGRAAGGDVRPPEEARRDPARRRAHGAAQGDSGVERHARGAQAGASPRDGGLRRLPRVRGPSRRAHLRFPEEAARDGRYARVLHRRRQRRVGRGDAERHVQRDDQLQWRLRARDARVPDGADRQARWPRVVQPLRGRLGARDEHAVPVDQAGRLALGWDAQRHDRALADGDRGEGRAPLAVPSRHRRRTDAARGGGPARAAVRERGTAAPDRRREHALQLQRCQGTRATRDPVLRDVRQPRHLSRRLDRSDPAQDALAARR